MLWKERKGFLLSLSSDPTCLKGQTFGLRIDWGQGDSMRQDKALMDMLTRIYTHDTRAERYTQALGQHQCLVWALYHREGRRNHPAKLGEGTQALSGGSFQFPVNPELFNHPKSLYANRTTAN